MPDTDQTDRAPTRNNTLNPAQKNGSPNNDMVRFLPVSWLKDGEYQGHNEYGNACCHQIH